MKKVFFFKILLFYSISTYAQMLDSTAFVINFMKYNDAKYSTFDSTLNDAYNYNILQNNLNVNLGNIASPSLHFNDVLNAPFFIEYKPSLFSAFFADLNAINFFNTKKPFTRIQYIQGKKNEQILKLLFTVNLKPNWNVGLQYNRHTILGLYVSQKTGIHRLNFTSEFLSNNKKWNGKYYFILNSSKWQENGGVSNDSLVFENAYQSRLTVPVNISSSENIEIKNKMGFLHTLMFSKNRKINNGLQHEFSYQFDRNSFLDKSPNADYYNQYYFNDSIYNNQKTKRFINSFNFLANVGKLNNGIGLGYDYTYLFNKIDTIIPRFFINGFSKYSNNTIQNTLLIKIDLKNKYYTFDNCINVKLNNKLQLNFGAHLSNNSQALIYQKYIQNDSIFWNRKLESKQLRKLNLAITYNTLFNIEYTFANIKNYFDFYNVLMHEHIALHNVNANIPFKIRSLHFDNTVAYNYVKDSIIPLPKFHIKSALYLQHKAFNKATELRYGVEAEYFILNNKVRYSLPLSMFYTESKQANNSTPQLNIFFAARLRKAKIFLRMDNILQNITHEVNFLVNAYPQRDRTFSFGIIWDLLN